MPKQTTVRITAETDGTAHFERAVHGASAQPLNIEIELGQSAGSEAEAIVHALRHASDVAANRFGISEKIAGPPPGIEGVLNEMHRYADDHPGRVCTGGEVTRWLRALLGEYGYARTADGVTIADPA